jgi:tRNA isopentenyl-2-thiomethyl-A-37 hydroxylase MiaE
LKTSQQWWNETKTSPVKLAHWLQRQAYGEEQAHKRIEALAKKYNNSVLHNIAKDELKHCLWITRYLQQSGIDFLNIHNERYWEQINLEFENLEQVGAVGYHAEAMRLERIKVIAKDKDFITLADIFKKIQKDEEYHVKAFKDLTTEEAIEIAAIDHKQGMNSLGLIA